MSFRKGECQDKMKKYWKMAYAIFIQAPHRRQNLRSEINFLEILELYNYDFLNINKFLKKNVHD